MSRSGWKWPAVGVASLLLVLLGAHLAWERHRYRLRTPKGTIRIGMTYAEVEAVLGHPDHGLGIGHVLYQEWVRGVWKVSVSIDLRGREFNSGVVAAANLYDNNRLLSAVPRPSLVEYVRAWLGQREE
jgi:hypothetical protein